MGQAVTMDNNTPSIKPELTIFDVISISFDSGEGIISEFEITSVTHDIYDIDNIVKLTEAVRNVETIIFSVKYEGSY